MKHLLRLLCVGLSALPMLVLAGPGFYSTNASDTRTVLKDLTGLQAGTTGWTGGFVTDAADPDFFINGIALTPGAGFDPAISFGLPTQLGYYDYNASAPNTYNFGTPIPGGTNWYLNDLLTLDPAASTAAAVGTYDFSYDLLGGVDATDLSTVLSVGFHIEVVDRLDIEVTGTANDIVNPGDVSHVVMTVKNNMTRDFAITSYFYGGRGLSINPSDYLNTPYLDGTFVGSLGGSVPSGDSRTGAHSDWRVGAHSAPGTYTATLGVVGGLYAGDNYYVSISPAPVIQAVPEPASLVALAGGLLALGRRRFR